LLTFRRTQAVAKLGKHGAFGRETFVSTSESKKVL